MIQHYTAVVDFNQTNIFSFITRNVFYTSDNEKKIMPQELK